MLGWAWCWLQLQVCPGLVGLECCQHELMFACKWAANTPLPDPQFSCELFQTGLLVRILAKGREPATTCSTEKSYQVACRLASKAAPNQKGRREAWHRRHCGRTPTPVRIHTAVPHLSSWGKPLLAGRGRSAYRHTAVWGSLLQLLLLVSAVT